MLISPDIGRPELVKRDMVAGPNRVGSTDLPQSPVARVPGSRRGLNGDLPCQALLPLTAVRSPLPGPDPSNRSQVIRPIPASMPKTDDTARARGRPDRADRETPAQRLPSLAAEPVLNASPLPDVRAGPPPTCFLRPAMPTISRGFQWGRRRQSSH